MHWVDVSPTTVHEEGELRMKFTFMTKKGHKQQLKDLNIPIDSDLVSNIHEAREALRDQHQEMNYCSTMNKNKRRWGGGGGGGGDVQYQHYL